MPVQWNFGGSVIPLDLFDVSGTEWRAAKAMTGMTAGALIAAAADDANIDFEATAVLIWIALARVEPDVDYEDVLSVLTFATLLAGPESDPEPAADE